MDCDVYQGDIFVHCNIDHWASQLLSLTNINEFCPSNTSMNLTYHAFNTILKQQQRHQTPNKLTDPSIKHTPKLKTNSQFNLTSNQ